MCIMFFFLVVSCAYFLRLYRLGSGVGLFGRITGFSGIGAGVGNLHALFTLT